MQAIMETAFDVLYLGTVLTLGILMIVKSKQRGQTRLFGIMAVVLGGGDAFHLIPRAYALNTVGIENLPGPLGIGMLVTSITMTVFYVLLYHVWRERYAVKGRRGVTVAVYALAAARVILCLLPQNEWTSAHPPLFWDILRNVPFALLGVLLIVLFYQEAKKASDGGFRHLWLAITLSFAFYVPVVLFAQVAPWVGMLMIPKTCAYVWIVAMGYRELLKPQESA